VSGIRVCPSGTRQPHAAPRLIGVGPRRSLLRGRGDVPHGEYFAQTYAFQTLGGMSTAFRPAKAVFGERIWVEVHPQQQR
jgi:hypothetical protein